MTASPSIVECMDDPNLFGKWFGGPSWAVWRAVLKAAFALPMSDTEVELFRAVAERDPPTRRIRELWIIAGRRSGKDSIASLIAAHAAAFRDYSDVLRPGEAASILCLACDRQQAGIVRRYTHGYFDQSKMLKQLVTSESTDGFALETGAEVTIITNNYRAVRGRSIALAILDETAYWRDETSATPDVETYSAIGPGMASIPDSMLIGMSSPYRRSGLLYQKWKESFGVDDPEVLVIRAPTLTLNPTLDPKIIAADMARDPARARSEWLAEWRDDVDSYLPRELIESAVDDGVLVRAPVTGGRYVAFADPSGGVADSFCMAVAHSEGSAVVLDCLVEIKAPFNVTVATRQVAETLKTYGLVEVQGDKYAAGWVVDGFDKVGIKYKHSERDRSAIYADALPLFTAGRARILDNKRLVNQFAALERKVSPGGRDRIGHPERSGHHDDAANACAGALVLASARTAELNISDEFLHDYMMLSREDAARERHQWATGVYS
jgi:hypothetical protein